MATVVRRETEVFQTQRGDKYAYCVACGECYPAWWHLIGGAVGEATGLVAFALPLCEECTRVPERHAATAAAVLEAHEAHVAACEELGVEPVELDEGTPLLLGSPDVYSAATEEERGWMADYDRSLAAYQERLDAWVEEATPALRTWVPEGWERDAASTALAPVWRQDDHVARLWIEAAPPWAVVFRDAERATWVSYTLLVDDRLVSAGSVRGGGEMADGPFGLRGQVEGDLARREVAA